MLIYLTVKNVIFSDKVASFIPFIETGWIKNIQCELNCVAVTLTKTIIYLYTQQNQLGE